MINLDAFGAAAIGRVTTITEALPKFDSGDDFGDAVSGTHEGPLEGNACCADQCKSWCFFD